MSEDNLIPSEEEYRVLVKGLQDDLPIFMSNQMNAGIYLNQYRAGAITEKVRKVSLNEYRMFKTYYSHIDPANAATRLVKIPLDEYLAYMGLSEDTRRSRILDDLTDLKTRPYRIKTPFGDEEYILFDFTALTNPDKFGKCYIVMKCSEVALPLFFFTDPNVNKNLRLLNDGTVDRSTIPPYTQLRLGTAKKANQIVKDAFFSLMAQYKRIGHLTISVPEFVDRIFGPDYIFRDEFGMETSLIEWKELRRKIQSFIKFARSEGLEVSFEPSVRAGLGGRIVSISFQIAPLAAFESKGNDNLQVGRKNLPKSSSTVPEQQKPQNNSDVFADKKRLAERTVEEELMLEQTFGRFKTAPPDWEKDGLLCLLETDEQFKEFSHMELLELCANIRCVPKNKLPRVEEDIDLNRYHFIMLLKSRADSDEKRGRIKKRKINYLVGMIRKYQEKEE